MLIFCVMKEMRSVSATEILVELSSYSLRIPISYIMLLTNSGVFVYTHTHHTQYSVLLSRRVIRMRR